jgi:hypothetical protein
MKKSIQVILIAVSLLFVQQVELKSDWKFDPKLRLKENVDHSKIKFERDYKRAKKDHNAIQTILGASIDFQVGYGSTNADVTEQSIAKSDVSTNNKGGVTFGALLNINLLDILNLTTGLNFTKKNFGVTVDVPYVIPPSGLTDSITNSTALNNSYLNIPVNINIGGMVSDKVGLSFSGGPYFGFLLNPPNEFSGYNTFDLGLNGIITANYLLNAFTSIILGTNMQYGGLNNLITNSDIETAHTFNWTAFTGLRIGFDF